MKYIALKQHARINGVLRSPAEGPVRLEDDEAKRLIEAELAEDVTSDFPSDDPTPAAKVTVKPSDPNAA